MVFFYRIMSGESSTKSLGQSDMRKGSKYDLKQDGRQYWKIGKIIVFNS